MFLIYIDRIYEYDTLLQKKYYINFFLKISGYKFDYRLRKKAKTYIIKTF